MTICDDSVPNGSFKFLFYCSLTKLKVFDVSNNHLTSLPSVGQCSQLTTINVAMNKLEGDLELEGLDQCSKLMVVDVSGNGLTSLASLQMAKLPQLAEVVANHNKLESLASDISTNWSTLKK